MTEELALYGRDLFGDEITPPSRGKIADTFYLPPFTVLNAREGFWQSRKAAWLGMGIKSELGRDRSGQQGETASLKGGTTWGCSFGPYDQRKGCDTEAGTSIFDPVLCELSYRWFCPLGGLILDPFAGGSVRGIVASRLRRHYLGIELRPEQIESNREQAAEICESHSPTWIEGDARKTNELESSHFEPHGAADFIFSCPPYGNLERYSDNPDDLSTMDWAAFSEAYRVAVQSTSERLRQDRFACFVVGNFRNKAGNYCDLVGLTVDTFERAGLRYYNEAVLVTAVGSLPIRIGKQFTSSRKLGKTHQNVLTFIKGDAKRAAAACEEIAI